MADEAVTNAGQALGNLLGEGSQRMLQVAEDPILTSPWTTEGPAPTPRVFSPTEDPLDHLVPYTIASLSVLILFCVITLAFNGVILASVFWIRRPMSPTLSLSISLAAADAYNALFLGTGLLVNSLLPRALGVSVDSTAHGTCVMLGFEALRLGGILVSVAHLLALAFNHYLGILRPLHYAATLTPRITSFLTAILWALPIAFLFVYFSSISGQGFQSPKCEYKFLTLMGFRAVFSFLFFAPLFLMAVIYLHIYSIVRRTQCSRQRSRLGRQLARNWKAVVTTMLILGTYLLGWIPAVMLFFLVCEDCVLNFKDHDPRVMLVLYILVNLLIILKSLSNPIIYAARMQEIKAALGRMKETVLGIPVAGGSRPAASGGDSIHGYGNRMGRRTRDSGTFCCCCRSSHDSDYGFYGGESMMRNRMSTYASTASGGTPMTTNAGLSFRIRSMQRHEINGTAETTEEDLFAEVVEVRGNQKTEVDGIKAAGHRVTVI
ncbi:adenosine receptor A1-like [Hetaerina americana]|uniref:adenosine receptor A1-like n=1 Tax=Hetaerina americana TaxID=62018 RepID=UPI003A7F16FF